MCKLLIHAWHGLDFIYIYIIGPHVWSRGAILLVACGIGRYTVLVSNAPLLWFWRDECDGNHNFFWIIVRKHQGMEQWMDGWMGSFDI